jgi:hypothetical protein
VRGCGADDSISVLLPLKGPAQALLRILAEGTPEQDLDYRLGALVDSAAGSGVARTRGFFLMLCV